MQRTVLVHLGQPATVEDLADGIHRAAARGFDGVETVLPVPIIGLTPDAEGPFQAGGIGAIAWRCTGIEVEAAVSDAEAMLACAGRLQARVLNVTIPPLDASRPEGGFPSYQDALDFAYHVLHEARFAAETHGVAMAVEPAADGCLLSPVELREMIDAANSWAVGACVDVQRVARVGCPTDWLTTLGPRVHTVRIQHDAAAASPRFGTSSAVVDLRRLAETLDRIGYEGVVVIAGDGDPAVWRPRGPVPAGTGRLSP